MLNRRAVHQHQDCSHNQDDPPHQSENLDTHILFREIEEEGIVTAITAITIEVILLFHYHENHQDYEEKTILKTPDEGSKEGRVSKKRSGCS